MSAQAEALIEPSPPHAAPSVWSAIREALAGAHGRDFTEGPIGRAIFILAVPMVLEMVMESIFAIVDVFVVAHLGADAVATVGLTESFMTILYALSMGLSIGAGAMISRRIGEKDAEGAAHTAAQVLLFGLAVSLAIGAVSAVFATELLTLMGAWPGALANASFTRIMLGCNASVVMLFLVNAVFRSAGDAAIAMRVLWLANAINIVLGPCLIFGLGPFPKLGVAGAAIATNIGRGTGALFAFSRLLRPGSRVDIHLRHLRIEPEILKRLAQLAWSAAGQFLIGMGSWIAYVRILSSFGSTVIAGYTIGVRVILFALLPASGLANAAATMVGQALGAKKPERAEQAVKLAGMYNMGVLSVMGALLAIFAPQIARGFTSDAGVIPYASSFLRTVACGFPFYGWGMVLGQSFNGAGDTRTPTWINFLVFWCWEIPLAYVIGVVMGFGPRGIFVAVTIAFCTYALVAAWAFRRGSWKLRSV